MIEHIGQKTTMQTTTVKANVLVVDDDEVVLVAVADLLEEAGYHVVTQQSPIGATRVIVRESIDAAIIDVNLPVMQGDNMVRLLQTWDRVKDIPIVIVSGIAHEKMVALQAVMPGVRWVPKSAMEKKLVATLDEALASRQKKARLDPTPAAAISVIDVVSRFTQSLVTELQTGHDRWRAACQGDVAAQMRLSDALSTLRGQAQLLGLEKPALLLHALSAVVVATTPGRAVPPMVGPAVESAIAALMTLARSPTAEFAMSPEPLIRRLTTALTALRAA